MYSDLALTANHGSQEVSGRVVDHVVDLQELFGESFPVRFLFILSLNLLVTLPGGTLLFFAGGKRFYSSKTL